MKVQVYFYILRSDPTRVLVRLSIVYRVPFGARFFYACAGYFMKKPPCETGLCNQDLREALLVDAFNIMIAGSRSEFDLFFVFVKEMEFREVVIGIFFDLDLLAVFHSPLPLL